MRFGTRGSEFKPPFPTNVFNSLRTLIPPKNPVVGKNATLFSFIVFHLTFHPGYSPKLSVAEPRRDIRGSGEQNYLFFASFPHFYFDESLLASLRTGTNALPVFAFNSRETFR